MYLYKTGNSFIKLRNKTYRVVSMSYHLFISKILLFKNNVTLKRSCHNVGKTELEEELRVRHHKLFPCSEPKQADGAVFEKSAI